MIGPKNHPEKQTIIAWGASQKKKLDAIATYTRRTNSKRSP